MKIFIPLPVLFLFAVLAGCSKSNQQTDPVSIKLKEKECRNLFFPEKVRICFDSLLTDSRCPMNVICIWQGYAAGKFSFTANNQTSTFNLSVNEDALNYTTDTLISGYKIEFIDLTPYPNTTDPNSWINKTATLRITKQ